MESFIIPEEVQKLNENTPFGKTLLPYFQMDTGYVNVNHGSYGSPPVVVRDALHHYQNRMEQCPDSWIRYEMEPQVNRVIEEMCEYLKVDSQKGDLVLIRNTTFGINSIFRSWPWNKGDKIFYLSEAYGMTKLAAQFLSDSLGVQVIEVPITFPLPDAALVSMVDNFLEEHGSNIKMAVFSHITSVPAVIMPVKQLIDLCRSRGIVSVIDGAHAIGQLDLDISWLDPDFYIGNGHKWLLSAKGAGILYVKKPWRNQLHSALITYGYKEGEPYKEFFWTGTADYSAYFTLSTALKFRRLLGESRIWEYCKRLSLEAGEAMARIWGTEVLITETRQIGFMNNIKLPLNGETENKAQIVDVIGKNVFLRFRTYMAYFEQNGIYYARISAHIYNDLQDYVYLAKAVLEIKKQVLGDMAK